MTEGEKGPREYEFVRLRVIEKIHSEPGRGSWLMARRPVGSGPDAEIKFFLSNAPETVALPEMAWVGCRDPVSERSRRAARVPMAPEDSPGPQAGPASGQDPDRGPSRRGARV